MLIGIIHWVLRGPPEWYWYFYIGFQVFKTVISVYEDLNSSFIVSLLYDVFKMTYMLGFFLCLPYTLS